MNQRDHHGGPPRGPGHFDHPHDRERYASREFEDLPSPNREWGPARVAVDDSFGQRGLGGGGNFGRGQVRGECPSVPGKGQTAAAHEKPRNG